MILTHYLSFVLSGSARPFVRGPFETESAIVGGGSNGVRRVNGRWVVDILCESLGGRGATRVTRATPDTPWIGLDEDGRPALLTFARAADFRSGLEEFGEIAGENFEAGRALARLMFRAADRFATEFANEHVVVRWSLMRPEVRRHLMRVPALYAPTNVYSISPWSSPSQTHLGLGEAVIPRLAVAVG